MFENNIILGDCLILFGKIKMCNNPDVQLLKIF